jgi:integrase
MIAGKRTQPVAQHQPHSPQVDVSPTLPLTDEEMARIVAACDRVRGKDNQNRMRAFVLTMRYSGLRISDMVALHPAQRFGTKLRLYTTKTGVSVFVPLPPFVNDALDRSNAQVADTSRRERLSRQPIQRTGPASCSHYSNWRR